MKISLSWLREFVDFKENASEIADFLSGLGLESEKIDEENINVEITANRGDALSILGLAREISAKLNLPLNLPKPKIEAKKNDYNFKLNFSDEAKKIVPRFTYRILKNIKIGPTPPSLVKKIESYGFRSINNVVDITNLVMIELGQPMHAFDAGKINYNLNLRLSTADEKIITLDGKEHTLKEGSLVGEDNNGRLIDLCGIMGGFYSEVDEKTTNIILQAAIFDPINIRKTSKYLNHTTDASYRYERGVDQDQTILALDRATELILQSSSGEIGKIADIENQKIEKRIITANYDKINNLLGIEFTREKINQSLEKLGFQVVNFDDNNLSIQVPSYRLHDIYFSVDLAEEVLRLNGYNQLTAVELDALEKKSNNYFAYKEFLRDKLVQAGFSETLSYSFISRKDVPLFDLRESDLTKIDKPMSSENEYFRSNLFINVLKQVARNPWFSEVKFFEIGRVVQNGVEEEKLVVMSAMKNGQAELKKFLQQCHSELVSESQPPIEIITVPQKITQNFKIKKPVFYFEITLDNKKKENFEYAQLPFKKAKIPSSFPPSTIDLAFIADDKIKAVEVEDFLNQQENVILAELFDEFKSDKFGTNKKNLAYHLWLEKKEGALSEVEIKEITDKIVNIVKLQYKIILR